MSRKNAPVVIVRKDKRLNRFWHTLAFTLTAGASAPVSAARAASNAAYNARTRKLQEQSEGTTPAAARPRGGAAFRRDHVPGSKEYREAHDDRGQH